MQDTSYFTTNLVYQYDHVFGRSFHGKKRESEKGRDKRKGYCEKSNFHIIIIRMIENIYIFLKTNDRNITTRSFDNERRDHSHSIK